MRDTESRRRGDHAGCHDGQHPAEEASGTEQQRRARDIVYQLLTARAHSRAELAAALQRKGIDDEVAEETLRKFVEAGLVDDVAFAETWVESRQRQRGLGRKALGFELRRKGVDEHTIEETLSSVDPDAEAQRARELVRRKLRSMTVTDVTVQTRRLVGMLARRGYSENLSFRIVREELELSTEEHDGGW